MKSSTTILVALGAVAVLGGVFAMAAGGGGGKSGSLPNPNRPGTVGGIKGQTPGFQATGIAVDKQCGVNVYDLPTAKQAAYNLGRSNSLAQAKALLYRAGECGVSKPLKPVAAQMRSNYLVTFELLRGSVDGGQTSRGIAELALMDAYFAVAVAKVNTDGLPRNIP